MASKWKGHYDSGRKYNKAWESKFQWVSKASDRTENAYCKLRRALVQPWASTLATHEKTEKHVRRMQDTASCRTVPVIRIAKEDDQVKEAEIELSVTVVCHSAILTMDDLGEVIVKNGKGSKLETIKLPLRKCTKIISKVVAPAIKDELGKDVKGKDFSVILDESTDISTTKLLCVMVHYHSDSKNKIVTSFVDLAPVIEANGETLFQALRSCLEGIGLRIQDCIAYGCDGASVTVGEHNSVWSRLRDVAPNCIQVKQGWRQEFSDGGADCFDRGAKIRLLGTITAKNLR